MIYYRHESLPGIRLYAHIRYGNVTMEDIVGGFFELPARAPRRRRGNNATGGRNNSTGGTGDAYNRTETEETSPACSSSSIIATIATGIGGDPAGEERNAIPNDMMAAMGAPEDIAMVRQIGFMVDDDNEEPAPENIPDAMGPVPAANNEGLHKGQQWEDVFVNSRRAAGCADPKPTLPGLKADPKKCTFWICSSCSS